MEIGVSGQKMWRAVLVVLLAHGTVPAATPLEAEVAAWRRARLMALTADGGWLTVTGRVPLHQGDNRLVLPGGSPRATNVKVDSATVILQTGGETRVLRPNTGEGFRSGRLELLLFGRPGDWSLRMKDPESALRRDFHGIEYFPVSEDYRVTARFIAGPRRIGDSDSPGYFVFRLLGRDLRLYPFREQPDAKVLLIVFRDPTTGHETYPGGRFLEVPLPQNGTAVLDFNKAYNPPCAFTPYVSCPLPPRQNRLPVPIQAGEKKYGH
jgi:uncharacterized protein (DUF1684 family)